MLTIYKKSAMFSAVMLAGVATAPSVLAQSKVTNLALEEVVVTAQKRAEDSQNVPISISALTETDLERRGVVNAGDLVNTLPNMTGFESPGSRANLAINLRGIGGGAASNMSTDPATAMYLDGVYFGKQVGSSLDVADLQRIEVLRGPQGTLYGRNATAGAINFITQKPTGEVGGKFTTEAGSDSLWGAKGTVYTGTLGTVGEGAGALSASFGAMTRNRDELYDNTNSNLDGFDDLDRQAYRLALRWEVNDQLTVDYAYDESKLHEKGTPQVMVGSSPFAIDPATGEQTSRSEFLEGVVLGQISPGLAQMNQYASLFGLSPDDTADRYTGSSQETLELYNNARDIGRPNAASSDINTYTKDKSEGHNLTAALAFDDLGFLQSVEFKSITGYRKLSNQNVMDLDGSDNTVAPGGIGQVNDSTLGALTAMYGEELGLFGAMAENPDLIPVLTPEYNDVQQSTAQMWQYIDQYGGAFYKSDDRIDYDQFSQELQMVGSADNVEYALGAYYFSDKGKFRSTSLAAQPVAGISAPDYDNETEAWALYGQTTIRPEMFADKLALTFGYRYTEESKDIKYLYQDAGPVLLPGPYDQTLRTNPDYTGQLMPTAGQYNQKFNDDFDNNSGTVTAAYDVADDTNVYLRWATGYRSGGFNGELFDNPYKEETIDEWELGVKSDVIPAVLRVNGALFAYTYKDQQIAQISVTEDNQINSFTGNAGKSERWGAEVEAQWLPIEDVLVSLSYSYMHGNFEEYAPLSGNDVTINTDNLAKRSSPDNMASGIVDWVFVRTDWAEFVAHTEVFWQSKGYSAPLSSGWYDGVPYVFPNVVVEDRTMVNMRLGMEGLAVGNGTLRAGIWAKNLFDESYNTYGINFASLGPITNQYGNEATYGVDVTWEF